MLVLKRKSGQWINVIHPQSGQTFRMKVFDYDPEKGTVQVGFEDKSRNFKFYRPEWVAKNPIEAREKLGID